MGKMCVVFVKLLYFLQLSDPCQVAEVVHGGAGGVVGLRDPHVLALIGHDELRRRS